MSLVLDRVGQESGIDFTVRTPVYQSRPSGRSTEGRIYYRGPRDAPTPSRIKLDLTKDEFVARPPVLRPISHDYPEVLPGPSEVRCYGFEEVFAEKLRAMGERSRPRDLYDIVNLFRRPDFRPHAELVREVLEQKCKAKDVPVPSAESIRASPMFAELRTEWDNMLAHQLQVLPDFEQFWAEVPRIFAWLNGEGPVQPIEPMPLRDGEVPWTPPATFWESGEGSRLEPVRFAAVNHLLVELGYDGTQRLIEPYSLRQTRAGDILLHAVREDGSGSRSYRLDRIQSVTVTSRPYSPRYDIEFPAEGEIPAPPSASRRNIGSRTGDRSQPRYVVVCPACDKRFPRVRRSARLRPHKEPDGVWDCRARSGYIEPID